MKHAAQFVIPLLFFFVSVIIALASAQSLPGGPYASWSEAERQYAAGALKTMCNNQCALYVNKANQGGARATYEAAACTIACFVNNLPTDYPNFESLKQAANQNYSQAKSLGSDIPVFLHK